MLVRVNPRAVELRYKDTTIIFILQMSDLCKNCTR